MKKYSLFIVTILLCLTAGAVLFCASTLPSRRRAAVGAHFLAEESYKKEIFGKKKIPFDASAVQIEGMAVPCNEETGTFYIPLKSGEEKCSSLLQASERGAAICILDDAGAADGNMRKCVAEGHSFQAAVVSGRTFMEAHLVFTYLPAVVLTYDDGEIKGEEEHTGGIRVYDPERESFLRTPCSFHMRGNTSVIFDKKSYRLELHDSAGNNCKESLLGMRRDDDWILNSLSTDCTLSREKICYSLWKRLNSMEEEPVPAPEVEYCEVFINNRYMGVYGLMFPVDRKLLELSPGDLLYKMKIWREELTAEGRFTDHNGEEDILNKNGFAYATIAYPKSGEGDLIWDPLQIYQDFVFESQDIRDLEKNHISIDRENFILHELFCEMTRAADNTWKNLFLTARSDRKGGYELSETIWDLNYTFGDVFTWDPDRGNTRFDAAGARSYKLRYDRDYGFAALASADPPIRAEAAAKWKKWRQEGIGPAYIIDLFRQEREVLLQSGAMKRDCERWDRTMPSDEYADMLEKWIDERFDFLDNLYQ